MPSTVLFINHDAHEEINEASSSTPKKWAKQFENFFKGMQSGNYPAQIEQITDDTALVRASGTVTVATIIAADTITINGTVLTSSATPSGEAQFLSTGSDTVVAAAVVACIIANSNLTGIVTASSALGVVTVSAYVKGLIGNAVTLASSNGTRLAVSAARLASGAGLGESPISYGFGK